MSDTLCSLSDQEVIDRTQSLVAQERQLTLNVLLCLNELEARQLYLKLGYGSLFDYCTKALGYSSSAAWRRIQTARCVARFPALYDMLERNEANLSTVSQVSRIIDESNSEVLLSRIRGKSKNQVDSIVAEYLGPAPNAESTRVVMVRIANTDGSPTAVGDSDLFAAATEGPDHPWDASLACEKDDYCRSGSTNISPANDEDRVEKRVMLRFSVAPEFMEKLERVRTIAWHRLPARASFEQIFEYLLDEFIERHDPVNKQERRQRKLKGAASVAEQPAVPGKRYIPAAVRDEVFQRDGGKCTFVGTSGNRCGSTLAIQLDHIVPVALGGTSTPANLRLLCAKHNRLEAQRLLGPPGVVAH
ncbi:MAG TPA: HNH endonuclease signature motif containing protein [Candidatus Krumholzibacteria bacterium]